MSLQKDTQLVSILYRTHKSLPAAAKVNSLYVFDALARAARHQVNKQGLTGDINSEKGNCATFLLKVEGVLEGLFQDMIMAGSPESKVSYLRTDRLPRPTYPILPTMPARSSRRDAEDICALSIDPEFDLAQLWP